MEFIPGVAAIMLSTSLCVCILLSDNFAASSANIIRDFSASSVKASLALRIEISPNAVEEASINTAKKKISFNLMLLNLNFFISPPIFLKYNISKNDANL